MEIVWFAKTLNFGSRILSELADLKETKFWKLSLDINTCQTLKHWNFAMGIRLIANINSSIGMNCQIKIDGQNSYEKILPQ